MLSTSPATWYCMVLYTSSRSSLLGLGGAGQSITPGHGQFNFGSLGDRQSSVSVSAASVRRLSPTSSATAKIQIRSHRMTVYAQLLLTSSLNHFDPLCFPDLRLPSVLAQVSPRSRTPPTPHLQSHLAFSPSVPRPRTLVHRTSHLAPGCARPQASVASRLARCARSALAA